jgi:RND superfamily putative drug exporter
VFALLAKLAATRARLVVLLGAALFLVAGGIGGSVQALLTTNLTDYDDPGAPGVQARADFERATGIDYQQGYLLLVRTPEPIEASQPPPAVVTRAVALLESRPEVRNVVDYAGDRLPALVSTDRRSTYVLAEVSRLDEKEAADSLEQAVAADPQLRDAVTLGGPTVANTQIADLSSKDLARAESIAFPIMAILLFLFFRGLVAAALPLLGALVVSSLALFGMRLLVTAVDLSVFSLNLLLALSLGLSIDFSLLMVSRFREHLAATGTPGDPAEAVVRTMRTTGPTVLFSGLTIAVALATLLLFPQRFLYSMGWAGVLVTAASVFYALVLLPALLRLLGRRVDALAPARLRYHELTDLRTSWWYRYSQRVMARPVAMALAAAAVLILAGLPFLGVRFAGVDASVLPRSFSAGAVDATIARDFAEPLATPVRVAVSAPPTAGGPVQAYARQLGQVEGVAGVAPPRSLSGDLWEVDAFLGDNQVSPAAQATVRRLAAVPAPGEVRMTGLAADFVQRQDSLRDRLPLAVVLICVTTFLLLFAFTGSVVLPVKALVINVLTISAALGVLVLVFQDGRLTGPLGYTSQGGIESTTPIILACIVFGLSTDYSVFLLGRIQEEHRHGHDTREAVARGLARTGRIVTSAAALVCVAIGGLVLSRLISIKELGVGAAFGVAVDATLARAVLVPALMALLGSYNWWAPGFLRRLHDRLGLARIEGPPAAAAADRDTPTYAGKGP